MRAIPKLVLIGVVVVGAGAGGYALWNKMRAPVAEKQVRAPVQTVKTAVAEKKSLSVSASANGYVAAIKTVDVRPQVQNVIRQVHVTEGQDVRAGQLLFTLDDRNDAATLERARGSIERDRADLADAEAVLKRNEDLFAKKFVSQAVVDTARNKVASLRGTLQADMATAQGGRVSLGYNRISASIGGRLGAINVNPGSLAQPNGLPLVSIAQLDPISVSFTLPESQLSRVRSTYPKGDAPVTVKLPNGKELTGKLSFIDNGVDPATGTIRMKAQFANADKLLWPGAFVKVEMISHTLENVVSIPAQAIVTGPNDKFVYIVQKDNSVKMQKVEIGAIEDGAAAVTGLPAGARVVIEGAGNLRPNSKVKEAQERGKKEVKPPADQTPE
jgi:RND family efflux transporter MFP subunit